VVATLRVHGTGHSGAGLGADPVRREALERARDTGSVAASLPVVQLGDQQPPHD